MSVRQLQLSYKTRASSYRSRLTVLTRRRRIISCHWQAPGGSREHSASMLHKRAIERSEIDGGVFARAAQSSSASQILGAYGKRAPQNKPTLMVGVPDNKSRYIWRALSMGASLNCFREQKIERNERDSGVAFIWRGLLRRASFFLAPFLIPAACFCSTLLFTVRTIAKDTDNRE